MRCHTKDFLNVSAHVEGFEYAIALVEYEMLDVVEFEGFFLGEA